MRLTRASDSSLLLSLNACIVVGMSMSAFTGDIGIEWQLGAWHLVFPASNLIFSLTTFPVTDIITEIYGKKEAKRTVYIGFFSQLLTLIFLEILLLISSTSIQMSSWKVLLGTTLAYFPAQLWNVCCFHWIKHKTNDRHLWIRNNVSTILSQIINSTIFISIVFGVSALPVMLPSSLFIKIVLACIDTPFVYLGCYFLKKRTFR